MRCNNPLRVRLTLLVNPWLCEIHSDSWLFFTILSSAPGKLFKTISAVCSSSLLLARRLSANNVTSGA